MEKRSAEGGGRQRWYQVAPSWIQVIFAIGSLLIAVGMTYADVQSMKSKITNIDVTNLQQIKMAGEINNLQIQIKQANETQERTNKSIDKLSDSVVDLGNAVSRLQGLMEERQIGRRK